MDSLKKNNKERKTNRFDMFKAYFLKLTILILAINFLSCSNDDDNIVRSITAFFPTEIKVTRPLLQDRVSTISYDNQNRINTIVTEIEAGLGLGDVAVTNTMTILYSNEGLISQLSVVSSDPLILGRIISYTYVNGILNTISSTQGGITQVASIIYDASTNKYTIDSGGSPLVFGFDTENNLETFSIGGTTIFEITTNSNSGIFSNAIPQPAFMISIILSGEGGLLYFFSNKEIEQVFADGVITSVINNRDTNNNITEVDYVSPSTGLNLHLSTTYESREL